MYLVSSKSEHLVHLPNGGKLLPGVNEIEDEVWESAIKVEVVRKRIELGDFEVVSAPPDKENEMQESLGYEENLKNLKLPVALKLVKSTNRKDLLEKWEASENRDPVKKAISAKLKELEVPASKDE